MEIINSHAHIYPPKIAEKATDAISNFYDIKMSTDKGTAEILLEKGKRAGVSRFVVHSVATSTKQVHSINEFILREMGEHSEFIGFMALHPDMSEEEIEKEVEFATQNGFKGIKVHPDFQRFNIDSEEAKKIYRVASGKLPILFHTGDNRYDYSRPFRLANIAKEFKNLQVIGSHFGGYRCWDEYEVYKGLDNVYFDTCSTLPFLDIDKATKIINDLGTEKFFFADDFPMWDVAEELVRFDKLKISSDDKEKILSKNVKNFLSLK